VNTVPTYDDYDLGWRVLLLLHEGYDRHQITAALHVTAEKAMAALDTYARSILLPDERADQ
jgi:hypothetical protein